MTPLKLALIFILVGVLPFLISGLASSIAGFLGTEVSVRGAEPTFLFGKDISKLLYTMFMAGLLGMFTFGFALTGLMGTALWALLR